ncbi:GrpE-domain-containing protein [Phakopsora pachyrhizi]|uniref:GrpE protein homolog, mitochondrial n=1 Tax=Phakopsora pachyrhizi TaxID=170000 RepID=A0AAV0BQJ2_PHAPC|nr:GrpE-domain-containing protein [Phakopsora pachyrhizi]CAH7688311.1 GrpE-domain-containing protein [Phakopsora pachyrhizi]
MASNSLFKSTRRLPSLVLGPRSNISLRSYAAHHRFSSTTPGTSSEAKSDPLPPSGSAPKDGLKDDTQDLAEQLAKKDAQLAEYKDLYIRARADYENLQKITTREKAQAKDYAIQSFAKDLVSNIDVLQLALNSVPEKFRKFEAQADSTSTVNENQKYLADLWGGVQSTKALLESTLSRFGVTSFDPTGEQFDPNKHEAMYQAVVPDKTPNSVLNCSKVGWMLRDRVLRPAQVGVAQSSE